MTSSAGSRSMTARATVSPPKPLSNMPIGRSSTGPSRYPGPARLAAMDLLEGLATTRAIRRYTDRPVTEQELATILWAATRAPSGSNRQPFRFLVLRDGPRAQQARALLGDAARRMWGTKDRKS